MNVVERFIGKDVYIIKKIVNEINTCESRGC